jgi:two-component system sensor histidine kinase YesM
VWLAEDGQNEEVIRVTSSLSNFFRSSLSKGDDIISIRVESLHIRSYLEIQQVRYKDILSFEIHIPEELEQYTIPKLTLQPLVENALYHGIKNKRGPGTIVVRGSIDGDMLTLTVRDDGIGMKPEVLASVRESINGSRYRSNFGMANVWERMRLYYGGDCRIEIDSQECSFTEVKVSFPAKKTC